MFVVSFSCKVGLEADSKCSNELGELVPIPKLPSPVTANKSVPLVFSINKPLSVEFVPDSNS